MNLKASALQGVKWTTFSSLIGVAIQIIQIAILARLLMPEDFGIMALAMVAIGFAQAFTDMGISQAIIHKQIITKEQLSTLYWLNIIAGIICCAILMMVSPLIAHFYHEKKLIPILCLVSVTFIIQAGGQQFQILLQKALRFHVIAKIEIASKFIGLLTCVFLAFMNFGVYALVAGTLSTTFFATCFYILIGLKEHRPQRVFSFSKIKDFLSFGLFTMGERSINFFNSQIDTLLIGRLLGMEALGIYNIAKTLVLRPTQVINPILTRVSLPVMAQVQNDLNKLRMIYLEVIKHLCSINFPIYATIFAFAPAIVDLLLGFQWKEAIPLVQILSLWAALRSTGNPVGSLILSLGRYRLGFWWNISIFLLILPVIYYGSLYGINGVALSLLAFSIIMYLPNWLFLVKPLCGAEFWPYNKAILHPMALTMFFAIFSFGINEHISSLIHNDIINMLLSLSLGGPFLLALYYFFNKDVIKSVIQMVQNK